MLHQQPVRTTPQSLAMQAVFRPPQIVRYHPVQSNEERVKEELKALGMSPFAMLRMESRYAPKIIHPDEYLGGVIYGRYSGGHAMIMATDRRVIFVDRKPLFVHEDEIDYRVVSGVTLHFTGLVFTITLHTKIKDYTLRTFNEKCARGFVEYIEARTLEHLKGE